MSARSIFDWRGQPSASGADLMRGRVAPNAASGRDAFVHQLPVEITRFTQANINTESETPEGKRFRLKRRAS